MKTQKIIKMVWLMGIMIVFCISDVFAGTKADELYQKARAEIEQKNVDAAIPLLGDVLASDDANDILKINAHRLRAVLTYFGDPESAKSDCNSAIMIAKSLIAERLNGDTNLSQDYLITVCERYGVTMRTTISFLRREGKYNESHAISQSYLEDVLKLGPFFDENGRGKIIYFAKRDRLDAAKIMIDNKQMPEAHNIYANAEDILSKLDWATPEMLEEAVYTMQMGALITSDVNDESFGAVAAELIEKNKTKPWIVDASIDVILLINYERQYELYTSLVKAQPTTVDDHDMALLYNQAYITAKETGHPEEAVTYYKTLKQKYPDSSLSKTP